VEKQKKISIVWVWLVLNKIRAGR